MRQPFALLLGALAGFQSCRSSDPLLVDKIESLPIEETAPAPYRIAVLPVKVVPGSEALVRAADGQEGVSKSLGFGDTLELSRRLVEALKEVGAASDVVLISGSSEDASGFDLVFAPNLTSESWEAAKTDWGRAALSTGIWLGTWVGGMFVDDKTYRTSLALECNIQDWNGERAAQLAKFSSGDLKLTYLDRNPFLSGWTLLTVIAPPVLTGSDREDTVGSLQVGALHQVAAGWKNHLRSFSSLQLGPASYSLEAQSPKNGAEVERSGFREVRCRLETRSAPKLEQVQVAINSIPVQPGQVSLQPAGAAGLNASGGGLGREAWDLVITVPPAAWATGKNFLRLEMPIADFPRRHTFAFVVR